MKTFKQIQKNLQEARGFPISAEELYDTVYPPSHIVDGDASPGDRFFKKHDGVSFQQMKNLIEGEEVLTSFSVPMTRYNPAHFIIVTKSFRVVVIQMVKFYEDDKTYVSGEMRPGEVIQNLNVKSFDFNKKTGSVEYKPFPKVSLKHESASQYEFVGQTFRFNIRVRVFENKKEFVDFFAKNAHSKMLLMKKLKEI